MEQYLIDNNVISNYFFDIFSKKATDFLTDTINRVPNISVTTEIEALSWRSSDTVKENIVRSFIEDSNVIALSPKVVEKCIEIRRNRKVKTPDAIIAATAIVYNLTLLTSDSDFKNIPGLKIINPLDL